MTEHKNGSSKTAHILKEFLVANKGVLTKMDNKIVNYEQQLTILKEENRKLKEGKSCDVVFDDTLLILLKDSMRQINELDSRH